ncbi:MAG: diaminopimelate decarboxylase [Spirochaetaceae bacterium]|nr:diaminopimelate decarboxylase [Spirochaetaceae bacterium]
MCKKTFPLSKKELEDVAKRFPTPFYLYDEKAIRKNARDIKAAFSCFEDFYEHFAVKALPNPHILKILKEEGFGADCSSLTELLLAENAGLRGDEVMFTSNETPSCEYKKAASMGAVINLDDITHIDFLEKKCGLPELLSFRYNPGDKKIGNAIIGSPLEAKYGLTFEQLIQAYKIAKDKGVKRFALHTMVASNELNAGYHIETGSLLFQTAAAIKERCGVVLEFINLGGGVGIPYKPEDKALDYNFLSSGLKKLFDSILVPAGLGSIKIRTEWGRTITGPYGYLVSRAIHKKDIYRKYIGLDASMADLMRPAIYGAYHHISVIGKENEPAEETYDVVGGLCENNDKFAIMRNLPRIHADEDDGDLIVIHDSGAHGRAMGFNYNGKLRAGELLLCEDGGIKVIRRKETAADYFATCDSTGFYL